MKPPRREARPLAQFMPEIIGEAIAARGLSEASLIADWPEIVGEAIARYARPIQLRWPARPAMRDPDAPIAPATLVLRVDGAFALEAQHSVATIAARVNAHLGWRCVEKIAFRQGALPQPKEKRPLTPAPSAKARAAASRAAAAVDDESLRDALIRLGERAIDKADRRLAATRAQAAKGD